jgi:hypothetical protein
MEIAEGRRAGPAEEDGRGGELVGVVTIMLSSLSKEDGRGMRTEVGEVVEGSAEFREVLAASASCLTLSSSLSKSR